MLPMSHTAFARASCADIAIPAPPRARRLAARSQEPAWREAMRWALIGLTASMAAGEIALLMLGL